MIMCFNSIVNVYFFSLDVVTQIPSSNNILPDWRRDNKCVGNDEPTECSSFHGYHLLKETDTDFKSLSKDRVFLSISLRLVVIRYCLDLYHKFQSAMAEEQQMLS